MVPIKFRCYRCNQLLGVSPSKIGAVVSCTKCAAELVVPDPDEAELQLHPDDSTVTDPPAATASRSSPGMVDWVAAFNVMDIRPEDIRVEPGADHSTPSPEFMQATGVPIDPYATMIAPSPVLDDPPPVATRQAVAPPPPPPAPAPAPAPALAPAAIAPTIRIEAPPTVPAIKIDEPATTRPSPVVARSRDLILPRSVVASWSLFVLLALMFAFLAGLFAGHYVWKVHEPIRRLGLGPGSRLAWVQVERSGVPLPADDR